MTTKNLRSEDMQWENVTCLEIEDLVDFEAQPFKVVDDEAMQELVDSIKTVGVLVPIIVRPMKERKYEIIAGHRRKRASILAGNNTIPARILKLNDDQAAILLVDSNLQREKLLPSERAYAYKLKLEALKHQGIKNYFTSRHDVGRLESADVVGHSFGESGRQVQRYIRLTELIYQLLDKVDEDIIKFIAGVEISYLDTRHQILLNDTIDYNCYEVNAKQGTQIKKHYLDGDLSEDKINEILKGEESKKLKEKISINYTKLKEYFPKEYTPQQCEEALWEILDKWFKK